MRFLSTSVLPAMIFALGVLVTPVDAETLATNLTIGSRGTNVTLLQQFLVSKDFLEMPVGVSYGYFGVITKGAVARWQRANGIAPAVGFFGPISRARIATEINPVPLGLVAPVEPNPLPSIPISPSFSSSIVNDAPAALGMRVDQVMLFRASPFEVRPGDALMLDGSGFSKTHNEVYFNGGFLVTATSADGILIKITVPTGLSDGDYRLSVSNVLGSSDNPDIKIAIRVTNNPQPAPTIEGASITGGTVTLVGSGFTTANNIITTLGSSPGPISANGSTLTFRLSDLPLYNKLKLFSSKSYPGVLWIYVKNEHGINKEPYRFETVI